MAAGVLDKALVTHDIGEETELPLVASRVPGADWVYS